ncbi:hypothetical protein C1H46_026678 [Malus baccata]|uniref:Uncharacterized protein n=1 Tax=Malus baccata TaxID=106549 RepID=A0A540LMW1_MALBA|nr:hypothetical protein C1H46_026678 [Malus baccata]
MERSGDEGLASDQSRARSDFHGDEEKQASVGSDFYEDEGKRSPSQRRTVQVQVEKPRYSLQGFSFPYFLYPNLQDLRRIKLKTLGVGGFETMEPEAMRQQFPFYNELQEIFAARMQRMLWAEESGAASGSKKKTLSSDDEEDNEDSEAENKGSTGKNKKKKMKMSNIGSSSASGNNLRELLEEFMKQQMQMEMQWREEFQARENERRLKEMEWRQKMEALENERIMMETRWREREEQRRMREEARAEKRDALITALLNKLRREDM